MTFYANKMTEILALPDGFKRRYMLSAMKQMMKDYGEHFDFLGLGMAKMSQMMPKMPKMPKMPRRWRTR
jgi:anaerobic magnesium-protoporphyrin IX monomethyl ester cyclase